jgi:hypothetical protein
MEPETKRYMDDGIHDNKHNALFSGMEERVCWGIEESNKVVEKGGRGEMIKIDHDAWVNEPGLIFKDASEGSTIEITGEFSLCPICVLLQYNEAISRVFRIVDGKGNKIEFNIVYCPTCGRELKQPCPQCAREAGKA